MRILKNYKILLLLVTALIFYNCSNKDIATINEININPNLLHKNLKLSDVFDTIRYLELETSKTSILGIVQKMKVSNSRYFFLTGFSNERIVIFGKENGNHILTIDENGRGPGEYVRAIDLYVDPDDQYIDVFSRGLQKLIRYDREGRYLHEKNIGVYLNSFTWYNQNLVLYASRGPSKKLIIETEGKLTELIDLDEYNIGDINNFSSYNHNLSFGRSIDNHIYKIDNNEAQIKYNLNFGKYQIPEGFHQKNYDKLYGFSTQKLYKENYAYNIFSFYESADFLILTIAHKNAMHLLIYSKETGRIQIADDFINDINNLTAVFKINREMIPYALDKDELIFIIEPVKMMEWIDQTKQSCSTQEWEIFKRKNESLIKLYDHLEENDNPVIAKCKLKKF